MVGAVASQPPWMMRTPQDDVLGALIDCIISERIGPDSVSPLDGI